jgi:UDP-N-acetyl-D-mannosaminuronic acid transferase (WecB/TagA/CpsF family)
MLQQPHKWRRYLIGNPKFLLRVAQENQARKRVMGPGAG